MHHHRQGEILLVCIPISHLLMFMSVEVFVCSLSICKEFVHFLLSMSAALTALLSCIGCMPRLPACMYMLPVSPHRIAVGLLLTNVSPCVSV